MSNPTVHSTVASNTETSFDSPEAVALPTPDDPEVPEVGAEMAVNQSVTEPGDQEVITTPPTPTPPAGTSLALCCAVEDTRNKHFRVDLVLLTNAELEKHLVMKPDNVIKMDNINNVMPVTMKLLPNGVLVTLQVDVLLSTMQKVQSPKGGSIHGDTTDSDQELKPEKTKTKDCSE